MPQSEIRFQDLLLSIPSIQMVVPYSEIPSFSFSIYFVLFTSPSLSILDLLLLVHYNKSSGIVIPSYFLFSFPCSCFCYVVLCFCSFSHSYTHTRTHIIDFFLFFYSFTHTLTHTFLPFSLHQYTYIHSIINLLFTPLSFSIISFFYLYLIFTFS